MRSTHGRKQRRYPGMTGETLSVGYTHKGVMANVDGDLLKEHRVNQLEPGIMLDDMKSTTTIFFFFFNCAL